MKKIFYSVLLIAAVAITSTTYAQRGYYNEGPSIINRSWSPQAKSAVLGAGGGAILGALLSRDHGSGAVVGAILGGGAGYLYGKQQERRYEPGYSDGRDYRYEDRDRDYNRSEYRDRDDRRYNGSYRYSNSGYRRCD